MGALVYGRAARSAAEAEVTIAKAATVPSKNFFKINFSTKFNVSSHFAISIADTNRQDGNPTATVGPKRRQSLLRNSRGRDNLKSQKAGGEAVFSILK